SPPRLPLRSFPTRRSSDLGHSRSLFAPPLLQREADLRPPGADDARVWAGERPPPRAARAVAALRARATKNGGRLAPHSGKSLKRSEEHTSELQSRENLVCR